MPYADLELLPDAAGQDAARRDWLALREAGLPSQADHTGPSNAPHLTLVAAPELSADLVDHAAGLVGDLLPVRVRAAGLLLLGGRRVTVARAVDVPDELVAAVLDLRGRVEPDHTAHTGWLPHLTLARRLPRADVQRAVEVLGHDDVELTLTTLRHWDPATATTATLRSC